MNTPALTSTRYRFLDWEEAQEYYHSQGMTDGLPVIPPTEANVRVMLDYVGLQPSDIVAKEDVRGKVFTAEKIAVNAVMAGCKPQYMPVVVAAVRAISETPFNLHANSTSTNGVGMLVLVSGPIAKELGINSRTVLMGHGFRANATIGRALGLIKINVYGSVPHDMDNSTFGHPGKYSFCFAEDDDIIPWESLRVEKGFSPESSTVTVLAAVAPLQVSTYNHSQPEEILTIVSDAMLALGQGHEEAVVTISPEALEYLRRSGFSKQKTRELIFEKAQRTGREWNKWHRQEHPFTGDDLDRRFSVLKNVDQIIVVGGGGSAGAFVSIIGSWGGSTSITKEIQTRR